MSDQSITESSGDIWADFGLEKPAPWIMAMLAKRDAEIARLRKEVADLREAARPFGDEAAFIRSDESDDAVYIENWTVGQFRRLAALTEGEQG